MALKAPEGLVQKPEAMSLKAKKKTLAALIALNNPHFYQFLLSILVIIFFIILLPSAKFQHMESVIHDLFFKQRTLETHPDIAIIEIAEDSLEAVGRWPWPRSYHAVLTHILTEWGAKAVVFDVIFSEPGNAQDDQAFKEALQKSNSTYFAIVLEPKDDGSEWILPLPEFAQQAKGLGHINIQPDDDGTLRRIKPVLKNKSESYPHIALKVAYDYLGRKVNFGSDKLFPVDRDGNLMVNWAGKWKETFKHYSYVDLLISYQALQNGKDPILDPKDFKGKICVIGLTATGLADIKANPVEAAYPASGIHANLINNVLMNRFLREASNRTQAAVVAGVGLISLLFFIPSW